MPEITFYRDSSKDIVGTPSTVYTTSTDLTAGMLLYDSTGICTNYEVSKVNNNSFELGQYSIKFIINKTYITDIILDGITYTNDITLKLSDGIHSLVINGDYVSASISSNQGTSTSVLGIDDSDPYTGSLSIASGLVKETTRNYDFGTCPITLTIEGSMNHAGGSN